jgi:magnesium-transporting ATPase (P-type)
VYRKIKIIAIISLFFINTFLLLFFSPDFFVESFGGNKKLWFWIIITIGLTTSLLFEYFDRKHLSEYIDAKKMAYTPHRIYGLYALIYFVIFFILFYLYLY